MVLTHTIGSDGGRDYATIVAWEEAWDLVLPGKRIGEVYHDDAVGEPTYTLGATTDKITIAGATGTSSTVWRQLQAATGHQYDPHLKTGVWIKRTCGTTSIKADCLEVSAESRFHLEAMAFIDDAETPVASGGAVAIQFDSTNRSYMKQCYVEWSSAYCDGTAGTATGTAIEVFGSSSANDHYILNCIVVGGGYRGNRGCNYGIRFQSGSDGYVAGCTVVDVVGFNASSPGSCYGIGPISTGTVYRHNCISVSDLSITAANNYHANISYISNLSRTRGIITSDVSGDNYAWSDGTSFGGVVAEQLFLSTINNNYGLLSSAPAQDFDENQYLYDALSMDEDYRRLNLRSTVYADIGALDGATVAAEIAPTTVVNTIGTGGDYADPQAWEAATDLDLVTTNFVYIGEMLGNFNEAGAAVSALVVKGALTDSTCYRELRPHASNHYKPTSETGCVISTSGALAFNVISIEERFFRLTGSMKVTATGVATTPPTGQGAVVSVGRDADGTILNGLYLTIDTGASACSFYSGVLARYGQNDCVVKNCVIYGHNGVDNKSIYAGIRIRDIGKWKIYNNSIFGTKTLAATTDQNGIKVDTSTECEIKNNIVIDCDHASGAGSADYSIGSTPVTSCSNNMAGDATAPGAGRLNSKTAANTWVNAPYRNYYLKAGTSEASRAGIELLPIVKLDAHMNGRYRPFDMGALEGIRPYPQFPAAQRRRRICHCYEIVRRDGVRLLFTDNNTPITFLGDTWTPASMDASARRKQLGMKPADLDVRGGITSNKITYADLRTGRYQGARVIEYLVDPKYPHLKPIAESRYAIEATTYDGEQWAADVKGLPFILQNKVGDVYGRTCRYVLGDSECRATLAGLTQTGKAILDVVDKRLSFYVADATLTSSVTNYYGLGKLTWLTGNNAGIVTELYHNEVVAVNSIAASNTLDEANANWSGNTITTTQVTNGFDTGIHSWNFNMDLGGGEHYLKQINFGGSGTLWSAFAEVDTKVCFSVWVRTRGLANPAAGPCRIRFLDIGSASDATIEAIFEHTGGVWSVQSTDTGTTAEVSTVGAPAGGNWYRLSIGRYVLGDETGNIGVQIVLNGSINEDAEFSQAQLEVDTLTPTSWTLSTKHKLQLAVRADANIANGDTFDLDPGCDKLLGTCKTKFNNIKNFGGFPYIPGVDKMFDTPTQ